jgi:histidine kinase-like protein
MTARSAELTPVARTGSGWSWLQSAAEMAALLSGYWPVEPALADSGGTVSGWTSAPLVATRTPPPAAQSVSAARAFTLRTLQRWNATDCADDVTAVLSELLTNALRHALPGAGLPGAGPQGPIRLGLLHPGPCVLCAVADPSNDVPVPREPDWAAETGRGLQVVASLSHRWGYCPAPAQGGKVVWATVLTSSRSG